MRDELGDRMKVYEEASRYSLPRRLPLIVRVDGKAFHTLLRGAVKPYDERVMRAMNATAFELCLEIDGAQLAYVQSDEISVLIHGYKRLSTQPWFGNNLQKIVSIAASVAAVTFTEHYCGELSPAYFDARAFVLPEAEVCNYFIWRQNDAVRNSIAGLAQSVASAKELHGLNTAAQRELCLARGLDWNTQPSWAKRGWCVDRKMETIDLEVGGRKMVAPTLREKYVSDFEIPRFVENRAYVERHLAVEREAISDDS